MLVAAALVFGLSIGDLYADPPAADALAWRPRHTLTGVAAVRDAGHIGSGRRP